MHKENFAIFREASLFMKVVDSDKSSEEQTSIFRNILTDIARYCRRGIFLGMDTQDSSEVRGMIEGSDDLLLICEMPSSKSREVTCEPLKQDRRMSQQQIAYIGWKIKIQEVCVVERGEKAKILKRIIPPRSRYWKSEYGDFYSLWKKERDRWINIKSFIEKIDNINKDRRDFIAIKNKEAIKRIVEEKPILPEEITIKQRKETYGIKEAEFN